MLLSMALILLCGLILNKIFTQLKLPGILGMLLTGMLLGPYALNLIDPTILAISGDLRQFALIIILIRAGLALDLQDLKMVGRPALLLSCVPALLEITGIVLLAPLLLGVPWQTAFLLGTVLAAVSPAIIVPRMLSLMQEGYGVTKRIPHLIMAGATVDDIFVIVLFTSALQGVMGEGFQFGNLGTVPLAIISGIALGVVVGMALHQLFKRMHMRDTVKIIILVSVSALLLVLESHTGVVPYSGLIAIMTVGGSLLKQNQVLAARLSGKFEKLWVIAQIMLFVFIGAEVQISYALEAGPLLVVLILGVLCFRMMGVALALLGTGLNKKERLFCMFAYIPKATVQAAIGAIPLTMGVPYGKLILTAAVVAVVITAPLGAILMDISYKRFLAKE